MFKTNYHITKSTVKADVIEMLNTCLSSLLSSTPIIRLSIFWDPQDNGIYEIDKNKMLETIADKFGSNHPSVSFIAQKPMDSHMTLEVVQIADDNDVTLCYKKHQGFHYIKATKAGYSELHLSGISASMQLSVRKQTEQIFETISSILIKEGMDINSIVRQWNYIERITDMDGEFQRYQLFNDERTCFYEKTKWPNGYPAATGIGMQAGGVVVDCLAIAGIEKEQALTNPLQIDAHAYTQEVLIGAEDQERKIKTTPKFERAKYIAHANTATVYVSGTAAIRGEGSVGEGNAAQQTQLTLENIDYLVSEQNTANSIPGQFHQEMYRVYVKQEEDFEQIKEVCSKSHAHIPASFLLSDVCRDELLVEIESIFSMSEMTNNNSLL